jgi:streptomycin 6-kinase
MTGRDPPGRLIGAGRAADVYDVGGGRVLRRYRVSAELTSRANDQVIAEARLMRYLRERGLGVPEVYDAGGTDLVMARIDGIDLLTDLSRRPWRAARHAITLAQMHDQLHEIPAPDWLPRPFGEGEGDGDRVMHLDLHPGNVMTTADGPMIIDWSNGAAGPPGADVAMASLIMTVSEVDDLPFPVRLIVERVRGKVIRTFEQRVSHDHRPYLVAAARLRIVDRNVRPAEVTVLQRLIDGAG